MTELSEIRTQSWVPPERPDWVEKINEEGRCMDIRGVVPLDEESLLNTARANTGLENFGDDSWYEPFKVYIKAAEEEGDLHLLGRIRLRSELLHFLEARLNIEDCYRQHPEIDEEQIVEPLIVIGQGRSGTSAMLNHLAMIPENGVIKSWEAMFPCPPPEASTYLTDPRIDKADKLIRQWPRVMPTLDSMHTFSGDIPTECVQVFAMSFYPSWLQCLSPVPSYGQFIAGKSMLPAMKYHKRVLKLLQWKNPRKRWVLKAPDYVDWLDQIVQIYPDAKIVWPHRDPSKSLGSGASLIGTLLWGRSDDPFKGGNYDWLMKPEPAAERLNRAIDLLEAGLLGEHQLSNVHYLDFVTDRLATIKKIYSDLRMPLTEESEQALQQYIDENPRSDRPAHRYAPATPEQRAHERKVFARYLEYFGVLEEE